MGRLTGLPVPHPLRALQLRLQHGLEQPSWVCHLPEELQKRGPCGQGRALVSSVRDAAVPREVEVGRSTAKPEPELTVELGPELSLKPKTKLKAKLEPKSERKGEEIGPKPGLGAEVRVAGRVWRLSQEALGCQQVQRAFEVASEEERSALAAELHGHVWEALRCPHANYVLQKCIVEVKSSPHLQFIIDELEWRGPASITQAARHCFGCRIVERLLESCPGQQVERLTDTLIDDALSLAAHRYGNYVVQHLSVHGSAAQQRRLSGLLAENAHALGANCYTSAVLIKALSWGPHDGQVLLARALLSVPGLFSTMARTRHGRLAAKLVLKVLDVPGEMDSAVRQLTTEAASFRASMQRAKCFHNQGLVVGM